MSYDWKTHGKRWARTLDDMEPFFHAVARRWEGRVSRESGEAPSLQVQWVANDDLHRSIEARIITREKEHDQVVLSLYGWVDIENTRYWKMEDGIAIPIQSGKIDLNVLNDALQDAQQTLQTWTKDHVMSSGKEPRSLPKRSVPPARISDEQAHILRK